MGLGASGLAALAALRAGGAAVTAWDDDDKKRRAAADLGFTTADLTTADLAGHAAFVLSPGIPHTFPAPHPAAANARRAGVPIIGDIEILFRACPDARYVAITGTNGKSTTTALIGHILGLGVAPVQTGGNLGTPALALEPLGAAGTYVLELSSYQLELVRSLALDVAVLVNIAPDHLDRHGGMAGYVAAKKRIFDRPRRGAVAVVGIDDRESQTIFEALRDAGKWTTLAISAEGPVVDGVHVDDGTLVERIEDRGTPIVVLDRLPRLRGSHNWQNAAAAAAACRALGVPASQVADGLMSFPGLAHRQELVAVKGRISFVNDSKATNADAASRALAAYDDIFWILGGTPKEDGLDAALDHLDRVRGAFLIGEAAEAFADVLRGRIPFVLCRTLDRAVAEAHRAALEFSQDQRDAVVLLSPACASFDQFDNFEHRGGVFRRLVDDIQESAA